MADGIKNKIESGEIMRGNDLRLIELAFDYVSAETEQHANYTFNQATLLATDKLTLRRFLRLNLASGKVLIANCVTHIELNPTLNKNL